MRLAVAMLLAAALAGCSHFPSCFVGVALLPPMPVVICGVDSTPKETE